jgi:general secretion pathway protein I
LFRATASKSAPTLPSPASGGGSGRRAAARSGDAQAGFTLIEVLIAITVVAVSLTAIGSVMATTTRGVRSLEQHISLIESARTIANNLPARAQLATGSLNGEIYGNRWRIDVIPFAGGGIPPVADSEWLPQTIRIRVQSPTGGSLNLETIRLQPRQSP